MTASVPANAMSALMPASIDAPATDTIAKRRAVASLPPGSSEPDGLLVCPAARDQRLRAWIRGDADIAARYLVIVRAHPEGAHTRPTQRYRANLSAERGSTAR